MREKGRRWGALFCAPLLVCFSVALVERRAGESFTEALLSWVRGFSKAEVVAWVVLIAVLVAVELVERARDRREARETRRPAEVIRARWGARE